MQQKLGLGSLFTMKTTREKQKTKTSFQCDDTYYELITIEEICQL